MSHRNVRMKNRSGFTLLETTVATVLVAITLVASLNSLAFVLKTTSHEAHFERATHIAQVLIAEVSSQPFADTVNSTASIGLETDEIGFPRVLWDDCDDYHGWSTTSITDRDGNALARANDWSAAISVSYAMPSSPAATSAAVSPLKKIQLLLTAPSGQNFVFETLRAQAGVLHAPQAVGSSILSSVDVQLQASGKSLSLGTRLQNQQEPQ